MNADTILPPIGPASPGQTTLAAAVLLIVLVIGFFTGRAKNRFGLLLGGLIALVVAGVALTALAGVRFADRAAWFGALLPLTVPLLVAFLAGWLGARAGWFARLAILLVAVLVLAAFPYAAVTARMAAVG
ncbi:hypothetical protein ACQEVB_33440 [Pseudonocardia sp. CA-107938]|uniref:hypothetical protein n=1 Tax=Pseudonocardia sp. CA-107938 TaxID=3240021 RepID=UPI003D907BF1